MIDAQNGCDSSSSASGSNTRLKVALITDTHTLSNYSALLRQFFIGLSDKTSLAMVFEPGANRDFLFSLPVEIIQHPALKMPLLWRQNKTRLLERLEKFKPSVLHCFGHRKMALTKKLAKHFDISAVVTVDSMPPRSFKFVSCLSGFSSITAPSEEIVNNITKAYPSLQQLVRKVNMGTFVDDNCACFSRPDRLPSMVVMHPLDKLADFEPLLCAVRHLAIDGYEFVLAIIGSGKAEKTIRKMVKTLGLAQIVNLTDEIHPLRTVFRGADIFIQPQPSQLFNGPLLEAMGAGMAVASCDDTGNDLVTENQTALLFDQDDELSVYAILQKLLNKHEMARTLAMNAQNNLRQNHTVSKMVADLLEIYRTIA